MNVLKKCYNYNGNFNIDVNIFFMPLLFVNNVTIFPYRYTFDDVNKLYSMDKNMFKSLIYPVYKHRFKRCKIIYDARKHEIFLIAEKDKGYENYEANEGFAKKHINEFKFNGKEFFYEELNITMTVEVYSYIRIMENKEITLYQALDITIIYGLVEAANKLNILSGIKSNTIIKHSPLDNKLSFHSESFESTTIESQIKLLNAFYNNSTIVLTGGTGIGKTSQIPKILLWFNFLFGGYKSLSVWTNKFKEKKVLLSLPRRILVEQSGTRLSKTLGFDKLDGSAIELKYHNIPDIYSNSKPKDYGLKLCTNKISLITCKEYDHVIIDEMHEHDDLADILITLIKSNRHEYKTIMLMTATVEDDMERIKEFFPGVVHIDIRGAYKTKYPITTAKPIKPSYNIKVNKRKYMNELFINVVRAIKKYPPLGGTRGILFCYSRSIVRRYYKALKQSFTNIHFDMIYRGIDDDNGGITIDSIIKNIEASKKTRIVICTPILESSITIAKATVIYDTGLYWLPTFKFGEIRFISPSMKGQRMGRTGRDIAGTYVGLYDPANLSTVKRIDYSPLYPYIIYGIYFRFNFDNLFIMPTDKTRIKNYLVYISRLNLVIDETIIKIYNSHMCSLIEYIKIYKNHPELSNDLDIFEMDNTKITTPLLQQILNLNVYGIITKAISNRVSDPDDAKYKVEVSLKTSPEIHNNDKILFVHKYIKPGTKVIFLTDKIIYV